MALSFPAPVSGPGGGAGRKNRPEGFRSKNRCERKLLMLGGDKSTGAYGRGTARKGYQVRYPEIPDQ